MIVVQADLWINWPICNWKKLGFHDKIGGKLNDKT